MFNNRPINDRNLQEGLNEIKRIMRRRGLAGAAMLVTAEESAYTYGMHAPWSALTQDENTPLGFRITAISAVEGKDVAHKRMEAALHTICQLSDFGEMTTAWTEDLKLMLRNAGVQFDHTPFGGKPLEHLTFQAAKMPPG